jgi:hypothetical protein
MKEIEIIGHRTAIYRGVEIDVYPELLQDVWAGSAEPSVLEKMLMDEYQRLLPHIRNSKIDRILE